MRCQIFRRYIQNILYIIRSFYQKQVPQIPCKISRQLGQFASLHDKVIHHIQHSCHISLDHLAQQPAEHIRIYSSENFQYIIICQLLPHIKRNTLIQKAQCITHGTVRSLRDVSERLVLHIDMFCIHKLFHPVCDRLDADPLEVIVLAPGQNGDRNLVDLCSRQYKDDILGRLLKRL